MAKNLKALFDQPLSQNNSTHATLLAVIGGYLIYMAYEMVQNTLTGKSTMSMTTTVIAALIMALAGLGTIAYGVYTGICSATCRPAVWVPIPLHPPSPRRKSSPVRSWVSMPRV